MARLATYANMYVTKATAIMVLWLALGMERMLFSPVGNALQIHALSIRHHTAPVGNAMQVFTMQISRAYTPILSADFD